MGKIFIPIFLILLLLSNAFLFKEGMWLYQDQSFWFKTYTEAYALLSTQFHLFANFGYYLGYDQGILSSNNIFVYTIFLGLFQLLGSSGSQIAVSILSYVLAFISFFLFSSLFFKDKRICYLLALLFAFNPLMYSLRGQGLIYSAAPLFVYSFFKFYAAKQFSTWFLLLNIFSLCLWIANVRFLQLNFFIVVSYLLVLFLHVEKTKLYLNKLAKYFIIIFLVFLPVIYAFVAPLLQKSPSIFNYGNFYNNFVIKGSFYDMFNPFQSANIFIYESKIFVVLGFGFFITVLLLLVKHFQRHGAIFLKINIALLVLGLTFFELGYIAGRDLYPLVIKIVPFLTNAPFNGLYVSNIPFILLLGIIGQKNIKAMYVLSAFFIIVSIIPMLNLSSFILQKYTIDNLPKPYYEYFVKEYKGIPESTNYIPFNCWRAKYMNEARTPTQCINFGLRYAPVVLDNPRAVSNEELYIAQKVPYSSNIENFRVTHNLKNIIVASDILETYDAGPIHNKEDIINTHKFNKLLANNNGFQQKNNSYFSHYIFNDSDQYDFFIYAPKQVVVKDKLDSLFDSSLLLREAPIVVSSSDALLHNDIQENIKISYKFSQFDATKYYLKMSNVDVNKNFVIQFNQAYKPGWELLWIDKNMYEKSVCLEAPQYFSITNNERCPYKGNILDIDSIKLLTYAQLNGEQHIRGNFLSNAWKITPDDVPEKYQNNNELYAIIVYKNQLYYTITLLISGSVLILLCMFTLMRTLIKLKK